MFISEEVEIFSGDYLNNPFGSKKDKRIDNWLSILKKLPLIKEVKVNLQNQVSVDFQCEDMLEIEELILQGAYCFLQDLFYQYFQCNCTGSVR